MKKVCMRKFEKLTQANISMGSYITISLQNDTLAVPDQAHSSCLALIRGADQESQEHVASRRKECFAPALAGGVRATVGEPRQQFGRQYGVLHIFTEQRQQRRTRLASAASK